MQQHTATHAFQRPKFCPTRNRAFAKQLKQEVNEYFQSTGKKKTGESAFFIKVPVVFALYLAPYFVLLFLPVNVVTGWLLCMCMGLGMAAIGLVVMHDANHHNATDIKWLNKALSYSMTLLGGSPVLWRIQHNVLHHTYTNIAHHDEDLHAISLLRFTPCTPHRKAHQFQHLYAAIFYSLLTINWAGYDDYLQLKRYRNKGLLTSQKANYTQEVFGITFTKLFYFGYLIAAPMLFTDFAWWQVLLGFLTMHLTAGLLLSLIFQSAHVTDTAKFLAEDNRSIEQNWLVHQLETTRNFGINSAWFTWITGGLNHQIEHHLFPNVSHVHYAAISPIVKRVAAEFAIPYQESTSFYTAVKSHFSFLKQLGKE